MGRQHDSGVQDAGKRTTFDFHRMHSRNQNSTNNVIHDSRCHQRSRAVGSHAAGIRSAIMIVRPFVILSHIKRNNRVSIHQSQNTGFLPDQTFFDHDL